MVRLEGLGALEKNQLLHHGSNPRPSGLYHSATTIYDVCSKQNHFLKLQGRLLFKRNVALPKSERLSKEHIHVSLL
jgi:hypothetical protein